MRIETPLARTIHVLFLSLLFVYERIGAWCGQLLCAHNSVPLFSLAPVNGFCMPPPVLNDVYDVDESADTAEFLNGAAVAGAARDALSPPPPQAPHLQLTCAAPVRLAIHALQLHTLPFVCTATSCILGAAYDFFFRANSLATSAASVEVEAVE